MGKNKMRELHERVGPNGHEDINGNFVTVHVQGEGHKQKEIQKSMNSYKQLEAMIFGAMSRVGAEQHGKKKD